MRLEGWWRRAVLSEEGVGCGIWTLQACYLSITFYRLGDCTEAQFLCL